MSLVIRLATRQDAQILTSIEGAVFSQKHYPLISARQFRYMLTKAHADICIAEYEGKVVGYALVLFRKNSNWARLYSLAVLPDFRSKSIGKLLLASSESFSQKRGCIGMRLEYKATDKKLGSFYTHVGYIFRSQESSYYPDNSSAIKMKKEWV
jgi:[ribosomal protein S18]-alanine N-acetyltransferase